jgi:hypothetical protein
MTILIPVLGYFIVFNATMQQYLHLAQGLVPHDAVPAATAPATDSNTISWRLLCAYFGLCIVSVGSLLYSWRCPPIVKRYASAVDFVASTAEFMSPTDVQLYLDEMTSKTHDRRVIAGLEANDFSPTGRSDLLSAYWRWSNRRDAFSRAACSLLFFCGFVLLAIPSVSVFLRVTALLWHQITGSQ